MTTAGLIIKHKQDHQDKTGHGQEGLRSAHCLLHLYDCPAFGSSGTKRVFTIHREHEHGRRQGCTARK